MIDLSAYDGLELRVKGDGRRYKLIVRISPEWDTVGYTASFDTEKGWQTVSDVDTQSIWSYLFILLTVLFCNKLLQIRLPFSSLRPVFRARTVLDAPPFDPSKILSFQACFSIHMFFHLCLISCIFYDCTNYSEKMALITPKKSLFSSCIASLNMMENSTPLLRKVHFSFPYRASEHT